MKKLFDTDLGKYTLDMTQKTGQPREVGGREIQEGGGIDIPMVNSC